MCVQLILRARIAVRGIRALETDSMFIFAQGFTLWGIIDFHSILNYMCL